MKSCTILSRYKINLTTKKYTVIVRSFAYTAQDWKPTRDPARAEVQNTDPGAVVPEDSQVSDDFSEKMCEELERVYDSLNQLDTPLPPAPEMQQLASLPSAAVLEESQPAAEVPSHENPGSDSVAPDAPSTSGAQSLRKQNACEDSGLLTDVD